MDDYITTQSTYYGVAGYNTSLVVIKIAVNESGDFYLGTFNGTANDHLLVFAQNRGLYNYFDFDGNLLDKSQYGEPHSLLTDLDDRQNLLAYCFGQHFKSFHNKGYIISGPLNFHELYQCDYSLENRFNREITVIRSFIHHQQFDYSWYNEMSRPIDEAENARWSPIANNPDQNSDLSRSFDVGYENVSVSLVWISAYTDSQNYSDATIYGMDNPPDYSSNGGSGSRTWSITYDTGAQTYNVHNSNCAYAQLFLSDQLPERVQMDGYTQWSFFSPSVTIAAFGEITTSNHEELPSPGDDNNPSPMMWKVKSINAEACKGDIDGDGDVDGSDLAALADAFGSSSGGPNYNPFADFDNDGYVNEDDLAVFATDFGRTGCPQ